MKALVPVLLSLLLTQPINAQIPSADTGSLPVSFSNNLIFATPVTVHNDSLEFYTDTGGGTNMIWRKTVEDLDLKTISKTRRQKSIETTSFPEFKQSASLPSSSVISRFRNSLMIREIDNFSPAASGFLGAPWFANRIWRFNYPEHKLSHLSSYDWSNADDEGIVPLHFQTNNKGKRTSHFPRMTVIVDGDSLDMLVDTGAQALLSKKAARHFQNKASDQVGTSFIIASIFDKWREEHPDWKIIKNADLRSEMPMIRVPKLTIANQTAGPVWFTKRRDSNFKKYMSRWMDKEIVGALGGSAFQHFNIIVDYKAGRALFELSE